MTVEYDAAQYNPDKTVTEQARYRVVGVTCPGPRQEHLLRRLADRFDLVGWLSMSERPASLKDRWTSLCRRYRNPLRLSRHLEARAKCRQFNIAARSLEADLFDGANDFPALRANLPHLHVHDVNQPSAIDFLRQLRPDCLVVDGTNLLRAPYFDGTLPRDLKIINIHTGLSPYARGGNCNLYCILHSQPQLVGVTVHYIDAGIDSGDIIYTARPTFEAGDTVERLELKTRRLGEDLLILALGQLSTGIASRHPQWEPGRLFLRRTGYIYNPFQRCQANELLLYGGLIELYLNSRTHFDEQVRVIEPTIDPALWRHPLT